MAQRKKKPTHYYLLRSIDYVSKQEIWSYVPDKVLLVFSSEDIEKIKYLTEYCGDEMGVYNRNDEGHCITINYPIEVEEMYFSDPEESMEDEGCMFSPVGSKVIIHPGYLYYKVCDDSDASLFIETEISLKDLKPVEEWVFEFKQEENCLEN
jgi:hypothetical protein